MDWKTIDFEGTPDLTVCRPGDYGDYDGNCIVILGDDQTIRVAVVLGSDEESMANARLFAAAPRLLEAAKQVLQWIDSRPDKHPYDAWRELSEAVSEAANPSTT